TRAPLQTSTASTSTARGLAKYQFDHSRSSAPGRLTQRETSWVHRSILAGALSRNWSRVSAGTPRCVFPEPATTAPVVPPAVAPTAAPVPPPKRPPTAAPIPAPPTIFRVARLPSLGPFNST